MMNWHDYFNLSGNDLYWKKRPLNHFSSKKVFAIWNAKFAGKKAGFLSSPKDRKTQYFVIKVNSDSYRLHNIIYEMRGGIIPEGMFIDHIDGNGLNNCEYNLRVVTHQENCKNRSLQSNNATGVPGITWRKDVDKWRVRIHIEGKRSNLGAYDSFLDAVSARKRAEIEYGYHANHGRVS